MSDQYTFTNPVDQYRTGGYPDEGIDAPGLETELDVRADHGEQSYRGSGRLTGRRRWSPAPTRASAGPPRSPTPARVPTSC